MDWRSRAIRGTMQVRAPSAWDSTSERISGMRHETASTSDPPGGAAGDCWDRLEFLAKPAYPRHAIGQVHREYQGLGGGEPANSLARIGARAKNRVQKQRPQSLQYDRSSHAGGSAKSEGRPTANAAASTSPTAAYGSEAAPEPQIFRLWHYPGRLAAPCFHYRW